MQDFPSIRPDTAKEGTGSVPAHLAFACVGSFVFRGKRRTAERLHPWDAKRKRESEQGPSPKGTKDADRRNQRPKFRDEIWLAVATP